MPIRPKTLLIYYAWPSALNNSSGNHNQAAQQLAMYDYIVLGADIELTNHGDHQNTENILALPSMANSTVFGYIDLGVTTNNYSMAEIGSRITAWKNLGADGIFFDDFGYDFDVSRVRQNQSVQAAHSQNMLVMVNAWLPDDVFGILNHPLNPNAEATVLGANDFYLSESYQIEDGDYQDPVFWKSKAEVLESYKQNIGFKVMSITTNNSSNQYNQDKFSYAWHSAMLYAHEATGWGEFSFSSNTADAPFRSRPTVNPGNVVFTTDVQQNQATHWRRSNRPSRFISPWNRGRIWIDTDSHNYEFLSLSALISRYVIRFTAMLRQLFRID